MDGSPAESGDPGVELAAPDQQLPANLVRGSGQIGSCGDIAEAKPIWLKHSLFGPANEQPAVAQKRAQIVGDYSGWHFVNGLGANEQPLQPLAITRLRTIRVPTLMIVWSREIPEIAALADKVATEIPGAKKVVIAGAGRMSNMEKPAEVNRALGDFLSSVRERQAAGPVEADAVLRVRSPASERA